MPLLSGQRAGFAAVLTSLLAFGLAACAGSAAQPAQAPGRPLAPYEGRAAELFDDAIEAAAVGISLQGGPAPSRDPRLVERTQTADSVIRARVVTVTSSPVDAAGWQLGLRTVEVLAGQPPPDNVSLQIRATDPAAGIVRSTESRLVGKSLVAFVRDFAGKDGPAPHFHVAPDSKAELDAVHQAALLGEVK